MRLGGRSCYRAAATLLHGGQEPFVEVYDRRDIDVEHRPLFLPWDTGEAAVQAQTRVVHQDLDRLGQHLDVTHEPLALAFAGEIGDDDLGPPGISRPHRLGDVEQLSFAPGYENQIVTTSCEFAREIDAQSTRRALMRANERGFAIDLTWGGASVRRSWLVVGMKDIALT